MNEFEFFDLDWQIEKLAAACVVAYYRTYILVKFPALRVKNAQVASALEEMLALMTLEGESTELFEAAKFWILDWQKQGFSQKLATKVKIHYN